MGAAKNSEAYRSEYSQGCPQALRERAAAPGTGTQIPGPGVVGASGGRGGDAVGGDGNGAAHLERLLARHRRGWRGVWWWGFSIRWWKQDAVAVHLERPLALTGRCPARRGRSRWRGLGVCRGAHTQSQRLQGEGGHTHSQSLHRKYRPLSTINDW